MKLAARLKSILKIHENSIPISGQTRSLTEYHFDCVFICNSVHKFNLHINNELKKTNYVKNGNISNCGFMTPFIPSKRWSKWFFLVSFFWGTFSLSHWHFRLLSQTSNIIIRYLFFVCRVDCDGQRIIGQWKKGVNSLVTNHYDQRNRFRIKR